MTQTKRNHTKLAKLSFWKGITDGCTYTITVKMLKCKTRCHHTVHCNYSDYNYYIMR